MYPPSLGKCWLLSDPILVWQLQLTQPQSGREKLFLLVDASQQNFGIRLVNTKPEGTNSQAALPEILRKHLPHAHLVSLRKVAATGNFWLELNYQEQIFFLQLSATKPPEISLIAPGQLQLIRFGSHGTFTKKRSTADETIYPTSTDFDLLPDLLQKRKLNSEETKLHAPTSSIFSLEQRQLRDKLRRRLKTLRKTLEKQQQQLPHPESIAKAQTQALLFQQFIALIPDGTATYTLAPEQSGLDRPITFTLDPDCSKAQALEAQFSQVKKLQRALSIGEQQIKQIAADMSALALTLAELEQPLSLTSCLNLARRFKLKLDTSAPVATSPKSDRHIEVGKRFQLASNVVAVLGRSALENDQVTKAAKGDDYWFHSIGVGGAHVVIPNNSTLKQSGLSSTLQRQACILALHYSKFKNDLAGEVYFTKRAHLKKKKGMPAGLWLVERSETLFIRYTTEERDAVLQLS